MRASAYVRTFRTYSTDNLIGTATHPERGGVLPVASYAVTSSANLHADLLARYRRVLPSFLSPYYAEPIAIDHGSGSYVWDLDGTRYLDFFGGVLTTMIGHDHPAVTAAVQAQAAKVMHTSTLYLSEPMIEFAEMVAEQSGIPDARVYFTPSGSEANDAALLLASSYRKSNQILAIRNSYHGRTFSTQAVTSHSSWRSTSLLGSPGAVRPWRLPPALAVPRPRRRRLHRRLRRRPGAGARHDVGRRRRVR